MPPAATTAKYVCDLTSVRVTIIQLCVTVAAFTGPLHADKENIHASQQVIPIYGCLQLRLEACSICMCTHVGIVGIRAPRCVFLGEVVTDHVKALRPLPSVGGVITVSLCAIGMVERATKNKVTRYEYIRERITVHCIYNVHSRYSAGPLLSCTDYCHCCSSSTRLRVAHGGGDRSDRAKRRSVLKIYACSSLRTHRGARTYRPTLHDISIFFSSLDLSVDLQLTQ